MNFFNLTKPQIRGIKITKADSKYETYLEGAVSQVTTRLMKANQNKYVKMRSAI